MLNITSAISFACSEYQRQPVFWIIAGLISLLLEKNIPESTGELQLFSFWGKLILVCIALGYFHIAMANVAIIAINEEKYSFVDFIIKPSVIFRSALNFTLMTIFLVISVFIIIPSIIMTMSLASIIMIPFFILLFSLLNIFSLSLLYILDRDMGLLESIQCSWQEGGIKGSISILVTMLLLGITSYFLSSVVHFKITAFFNPIYWLVCSHFYMQIKVNNELLLNSKQWSLEHCFSEEEKPEPIIIGDNKSVPSIPIEPVTQYYNKLGGMWDTISCVCGWKKNLEPTSSEPSITCPQCGSTIHIKWG